MIKHKQFLIASMLMLIGVGIGLSFRHEALKNATTIVLRHHKIECTKAIQTIAVIAYLEGKEDGCITH